MVQPEACTAAPNFPSLVERYYSRNYLHLAEQDLDEMLKQSQSTGHSNLEQYYHIHSNKLVLFGITSNHDAIKNHAQNPILKVKFSEERTSGISGKRKQGATNIDWCTIVCEIVT